MTSLVVILFSVIGLEIQKAPESYPKSIAQNPFSRLIYRLDLLPENSNAFIRHFAPTWRSLKKIIDLPYVVRYVFHTTDLPKYELSINDPNLKVLISNLPNYPEEKYLTEEFKVTQGATFITHLFSATNTDVRFRGGSSIHWDSFKKSWQIQLPRENLLGSKRNIRLVLPEDRGWIEESLNMYHAKKLGLLAPDFSYVRLFVNENDMGTYLLIEGWEEDFLETNNRPLGPIFAEKDTYTDTDLLLPENISFWEDRMVSGGVRTDTQTLEYFLKLLAYAPDELFGIYLPSILDMESFYKWNLVNLLAGTFHQVNIQNQNIYFNNATGKFEIIAFDIGPNEKLENGFDTGKNRLINRALSNSKFRHEFEKVVSAYVADGKNLEDSLSYYDELVNTLKPEFLSDFNKLPTNLEALRDIRTSREVFEYNFYVIKDMIEKEEMLDIVFGEEIYPLEERTFGDSAFEKEMFSVKSTPLYFVKNHPSFILSGENIVLPKGTYTFTKNVIVPKNSKLIIEPGTSVHLGKNISFISYSPIDARGTSAFPIIIEPLGNSSWGVFGVVDQSGKTKSILSHIQISGGSESWINGIFFSGELSFHNTYAELNNVTVKDAKADDGLHGLNTDIIVKNSSFLDNSADAIDIDLTRSQNSLLKNNFFYARNQEKGNGDAIDISHAEINLQQNTVIGCGDKGASIGERSHAIIESFFVDSCVFGIAIKDGSFADLDNIYLSQNETGIGLYRKKPHFVIGGDMNVNDVYTWKNGMNVYTDKYTNVHVDTIEGIFTKDPVDFLKLNTWIRNVHLLNY